MSSRTSSYYLPVEPFLLRTQEWLTKYQAGYGSDFAGGTRPIRPEWSRMTPTEYLILQSGVSRAWMDKFLQGKSKTIHFDTADKLLCAMNIAHEWLTTFKSLYEGIDFKELDHDKPIHYRRHGGGMKRSVPYTVIANLFRAGMSRQKIMETTGATQGVLERALAVEGVRKNQLGLAGRQRSFDYAKAKRLHDAHGLTWVEVAEQLQVDVRVVYQAMRRVRKGQQILGAA